MPFLIEPWWLLAALILACFISASLHSSVGLAGGSSYVAWMVIFSVSAALIPTLALSLNVLVSSIASLQFWRKRLIPWKLVFLLLASSTPAAYLGGSFSLNHSIIQTLLLICLIFVLIRLCLPLNLSTTTVQLKRTHIPIILLLGSLLGFLAGLVGIGGGIYLVPLLLILGICNMQHAAAAGSLFILCNSSAALFSKWQHNLIQLDALQILPLLTAVSIGGIVGSHLAISEKHQRLLRKLLTNVIALACVLLAWKLFNT